MSFILLGRERLELARRIHFFVNFESFIPVLPPLYRNWKFTVVTPFALQGGSNGMSAWLVLQSNFIWDSTSTSVHVPFLSSVDKPGNPKEVGDSNSEPWGEWNTHRGKRFNVIPLFARVGNWGSARVSFGNHLWLLETLVFANAFIQTASLVEFSERRKEGRKEGREEGRKEWQKETRKARKTLEGNSREVPASGSAWTPFWHF